MTMNKRLISLLMIMLLAILLSACNQKKQMESEPAFLDVKIETKDHIERNKETEIACVVTYGDEKVTDADEVKFEIWKNGEEKHEMLKAEHKGGGKYAVKKTFTEDGTYSIVAHVTARSMHNMPKKEIVVGNPETAHQTNEENQHQDSHHSHHQSNVLITFHKEHAYAVNMDSPLIATIQLNNQPLSGAEVKFEVWKEGDKNHQFIDAKEQQKGEYKGIKQFKEPGIYYIKVHVEKDEIHEHQVEKVNVQ